MATGTTKKTEVGSYFIANYPPFSQWTVGGIGRQCRLRSIARPSDVPLGLYLHIPFCRKRCKFCYFRVYTDKNANEVEQYVAALVARDRAGQPAAGHGRPAVPLRLFRRRHAVVPQRQATHVARRSAAGQHQLGPGRGSHVRVRAGHAVRTESSTRCKELGVTRHQPGRRELQRCDSRRKRPGASVGAKFIKSWQWILDAGFPNTNIDLISGMVGENWDNWRDTVRQTIDCSPDSVTIYQMELPFNTVYSQRHLGQSRRNAGGRLADEAGLGRLRLRRTARRRLSAFRAPTRW